MAKTFDNISDASATNYLFLFAQRTLALQNEPPTPPPLNALGLPCHAVCLLWERMQKHQLKQKVKRAEAVGSNATGSAVGRAAVTCGEDDGGGGGEGESGGAEGEGEGGGSEGQGESGGGGKGGGGESEHEGGEGGGRGGIKAATEKKANVAEAEAAVVEAEAPEVEAAVAADVTEVAFAMEAGQEGGKKNTFAQKIAPLAQKITEYINDHQDDAAQEDRWRTIMKRETMKRFREQREASDTQGKAIAEMREAIDKQREAIAEQVREALAEVREAVDKQRGASDKQRDASDT